VRLQPGARDVDVRFTALRFGSPDHVRFRYRLSGSDQNWVDAAGRTVRFNNLAPGSYRLQLAARDDAGDWSAAPVELTIEQLPRFHQTLLFKFLLATLCAAAGFGLYRWRIRSLTGRYAAVMAERNRIAREWHDTLLAGLSGVSWQLQATRSRLRDQPGQAPGALDLAQKMVDHCQSEARRAIWDLREGGPENEKLPTAVSSFLEKLRHGLDIEATVETRGQYLKLPYDVEHNALRVGQEAIANAVHHASPSRISVVLEYTAKQLMLRVSDNGKGFQPQQRTDAQGHFGILGMQERVLSFGGDFRIQSAPGAGTVVEASFPL